MALLLGARLADGCTARAALPGELRKARGQGARHWMGTLTLTPAARTAAQQVAEATAGESRESVAAALDKLMSVVAPILDPPSRSELRQLLVQLRAP